MDRKDIRYVTQDGADFYLYLDAGMTRFLRTVSYPGVVTNAASAQLARKWFVTLHEDARYDIEWPNPFGGE